MESPAPRIKATTTGRRQSKTLCRAVTLLYFSYRMASTETNTSAGVMQPRVAITAPGTEAMRNPTKVAAFTAMGPGVISAIVTRSVNSCMVSHACRAVTWLCISGIAA